MVTRHSDVRSRRFFDKCRRIEGGAGLRQQTAPEVGRGVAVEEYRKEPANSLRIICYFYT